MRPALFILAILSPFVFTWGYTLCIGAAAAFFEPLMALLVGVLVDALYLSPGVAHFPWGTLLGTLGYLGALLVHRFVKARIMS